MEQFSTCWIKCKTKPGLNMKKIDEFRPYWRQNLAESDKGSWFNQLSVGEEACASSLHVSAGNKKKLGARKAEESNVRESDFQEQDQIILHRRILHCLNRVPPWNHAAALVRLFVSVLWKYVLFLSLPVCLFWPRFKRLRLERDWNAIASPEALSFQLGKMSDLFLEYMLKWIANYHYQKRREISKRSTHTLSYHVK